MCLFTGEYENYDDAYYDYPSYDDVANDVVLKRSQSQPDDEFVQIHKYLKSHKRTLSDPSAAYESWQPAAVPGYMNSGPEYDNYGYDYYDSNYDDDYPPTAGESRSVSVCRCCFSSPHNWAGMK